MYVCMYLAENDFSKDKSENPRAGKYGPETNEHKLLRDTQK